jgi:hypothetical protein
MSGADPGLIKSKVVRYFSGVCIISHRSISCFPYHTSHRNHHRLVC